MRRIAVVGNARCYHTMDWYRTIQRLLPDGRIDFLTDLVDSEQHVVLVRPSDPIVHLLNVDGFLCGHQSSMCDRWRNAVKLLAAPIQVHLLRRYAKQHSGTRFHAHTMYYMFLCWLAGVDFVGTPQGSEILVRPHRSGLYRHFAVRALRAASAVTVDSIQMQNGIRALAGVEAIVLQNGIDTSQFARRTGERPRTLVVSPRGFTELYRIDVVLTARAQSETRPSLTFIYPFWDEQYRDACRTQLEEGDRDLGRLDKPAMYDLLSQTKLVISIPSSDSSPRTIYEAIFAGACVGATYGSWIDSLPSCMRERVFVVDLNAPNWFDQAMAFADARTRCTFTPTREALDQFDQTISMQRAVRLLYAA